MPTIVKIDDKDVEVFTAEELEAAKTEAATAAVAAAKAEFEGDPNGIAAKARREAEKKLKDKEKEHEAKIAEMQAAIASGSKSKEEFDALQAQLAESKAAVEKATADAAAAQAAFARKYSLIEMGIKPGSVTRAEALIAADAVDVSDAEAMKKYLESLQIEAPGMFNNSTSVVPNPNSGATQPPKGTLTNEQLEKSSMDEYIRARKGG